ncbi:MAG TPA: carboxymuconolactone decarboxylase family protein [Acidimicrobiales bacterium]
MSPRIAPLPLKEWPGEMREALAAMRPPEPRHPLPTTDGGRPKALNALGTMARYPALTRAYHVFSGHVQYATTLSVPQRERLVLRVAAVRRCAYEWMQHVVLARDAGLGDEEIARIAEGPDAADWAPLDRALLRAVDELLADAEISDATWEALARELDERQLMDLVFTVGAYDALAMALRTFGVEADDDLLRAVAGGPELEVEERP